MRSSAPYSALAPVVRSQISLAQDCTQLQNLPILDHVFGKELQRHKTRRGRPSRRLARGHSEFLGLIVSDIGNPFFPEVIKSFEAAALARGLDLLLCNTNYDPERTEAAVRKMIENKVRGVAVMTSEWGTSLAENLVAHHVPVVFLDLGTVGKYISNIRVDYSRGICQAIDHLHGLGHREFTFIAGPQTLRSAITRRNAFIDALKQRGSGTHRTVEGNHKVDGGIRAVQALPAHRPLFSAILCSNDLTAIGALGALAEAGVRVPEDVSVVGFDDIDFAHIVRPALTTVELRRDQFGRLAFEAPQKIMHSKRRQGTEYVVETHLVIRQSTAPARSHTCDVPTPVAAIEERQSPPDPQSETAWLC